VEETAFILVKHLRRAGEPSAKPPGSQAHAADDTFCWRTTPQRGDKVLDDGSRARITSLHNLTVQLRRVAATFRPTGQDVVAVGVEDARPSASWLGLWAFRCIEVLAHGPAIDSQTVSHCPDGLCLCIEVVDLVIEGLPPLLPLPPLGVLAGLTVFELRRTGSFRCRLRLLNANRRKGKA